MISPERTPSVSEAADYLSGEDGPVAEPSGSVSRVLDSEHKQRKSSFLNKEALYTHELCAHTPLLCSSPMCM